MLLLQNLTLSVEDKIVVHDLSLSILPGSLHVMMGQNGSGKSSLAYGLLGLPAYQKQAGTMMFLNHDLADLSIHERSKQGIFLAFQQPLTIPGVTVFQFLKEIYTASQQPFLATQDFQELVQNVLLQVGLDVSFLYRGLNENFSGGEKKRLEIAQMLVLQPKLIILDEIDSGLDVDALRTIGRTVHTYLQANSQASCLVITHYRRILEYLQPDFVHIMHAGTIVATGDVQLSYQIEEQGYDIYGR